MLSDDEGPTAHLETATLAGGCFWCLEPAFEELRGVREVTVGYAGGDRPSPTYEQVCTGRTGHAEVAQVVFDPDEISYRDLLQVFFTVHDPTQLNRQGADVGTQYRSMILAHDEAQRETAESVIRELEREGVWQGIVTEVVPLVRFWPAEAYHQGYYRKHPEQGYCQAVIRPKLAKFRKRHAGLRKESPQPGPQ